MFEIPPEWVPFVTSTPFVAAFVKLFGAEVARVAHAGVDRYLLPFEERTKTKLLLVQAEEKEKLALAAQDRAAASVPELASPGPPSDVPLRLAEDDSLLRLEGRANARARYDRIQRQANLEGVFLHMLSEPPPQVEATDQKLSGSFLSRFGAYASEAEEEEVQVLWARLLANEIANPGRFSARTLDVVRNLSSVEAQLFRRACQCSFDPGYLMRDNFVTERAAKLTDLDLSLLAEAGLLTMDIPSRLKFERIDDAKIRGTLPYFDKLVIFEGPVVRFGYPPWSITLHIFTTAGRQLRTLVPQIADPEMVRVLEGMTDDNRTVRVIPQED